MKHNIYALLCPDTKVVKYIGATKKKISIRLSGHIADLKNKLKKGIHLCAKDEWILELDILGKRPLINLLEQVDSSIWEQSEKLWIERYKSMGYLLVNSAIGGKGTQGFSMDKDSIEKLRNTKTGVKIKSYYRDYTNIVSIETNEKRSKSITKCCNSGKRKMPDKSKALTTHILQLTKNGDFIAEYPTTVMASEKTGIKRTTITENLRLGSKSRSGFIFKYKNPKP